MSVHSSRGTAWDIFRIHILDRDEWTCQYCGVELQDGAEGNATVEHRMPKLEGGQDTDANCFAACRSCNSKRGTKPIVRTVFVNKRWLPNGLPRPAGGRRG